MADKHYIAKWSDEEVDRMQNKYEALIQELEFSVKNLKGWEELFQTNMISKERRIKELEEKLSQQNKDWLDRCKKFRKQDFNFYEQGKKELEAKSNKAVRIMKGLWLSEWIDRKIVEQFLYQFGYESSKPEIDQEKCEHEMEEHPAYRCTKCGYESHLQDINI